MKRMNRVLSLLLALCMIATLLPAQILAADGEQVTASDVYKRQLQHRPSPGKPRLWVRPSRIRLVSWFRPWPGSRRSWRPTRPRRLASCR